MHRAQGVPVSSSGQLGMHGVLLVGDASGKLHI